MKKYVYFFSGAYTSKNGLNLFHGETKTDRRINSFEDIKEITETVKKRIGQGYSPTILNYKLLRVEEEGGSDA